MDRELRSCVWKGGAKRGKVLVCVAVRCTGEARSIAWQGRSGRRDKCAVQVSYQGFYARLLSARIELTSLLCDNATFLNNFGFWSFFRTCMLQRGRQGCRWQPVRSKEGSCSENMPGFFRRPVTWPVTPHAEPHPMHHPSLTGNEIRNLTAAVF